MSLVASERNAPYLLAAPGLLVFLGLVIIPLGMTALLSFYDWGQYKGIVPTFTLKNWVEIATDSYFFEVFLRTFRIAILVTVATILIGVPEAYILNRMAPAWRSICMLVVIGPLLVSVVARTLGWALLLGSTGLVNQGLIALGLIDAARVHVHRDRRRHRARPCPDALHDPGGLGLAAAARPADRERGDVARRRLVDDLAARDPAADRARHPVRRDHRLRTGGERLRLAGDHRRAPAQGRGDARL